MTDIYCYCPTCNKEDGKEKLVNKVVLVNGMMLFYLECGHVMNEKFGL